MLSENSNFILRLKRIRNERNVPPYKISDWDRGNIRDLFPIWERRKIIKQINEKLELECIEDELKTMQEIRIG